MTQIVLHNHTGTITVPGHITPNHRIQVDGGQASQQRFISILALDKNDEVLAITVPSLWSDLTLDWLADTVQQLRKWVE